MIFSSFGPLGNVLSLQQADSSHSLDFVLEENGLLVDGKILKEHQWQVTERERIKAKKKLRHQFG